MTQPQKATKTPKVKRSKASLYKLSDPHKFDQQDEWGDINPVNSEGDYRADLTKRGKNVSRKK
jgi:hypothetical protein